MLRCLARPAAKAKVPLWSDKRSFISRTFSRFKSSEAKAAEEVPYRIPKSNSRVSRWLLFNCGVVGTVVVVGGVTRLTESGLSIVDWKPIAGMKPPISDAEWDAEFTRYQSFPEFQQKSDMTLSEFKSIFFWEWFHRFLARSIGITYAVPLFYFASRKYFASHAVLKASLVGILALGGMQGALGWYMVKSGLDPKLLDEKRKATVSAYRLAAHLTLAFTIYAGMLRIAMGLRCPATASFPGSFALRQMARLSFTVMFGTAVSGAFVAGLDAGLLYNDGFPLMGGRVFPPWEDIFPHEPWFINLLENPASSQVWHRVMAGTTTVTILLMNLIARRRYGQLPRQVKKKLHGVNGALGLQVGLGIATLMSYVETPVAASHQAGSLILLTTLIRLCAVLGSRGTILI